MAIAMNAMQWQASQAAIQRGSRQFSRPVIAWPDRIRHHSNGLQKSQWSSDQTVGINPLTTISGTLFPNSMQPGQATTENGQQGIAELVRNPAIQTGPDGMDHTVGLTGSQGLHHWYAIPGQIRQKIVFGLDLFHRPASRTINFNDNPVRG